MALSIPLIYFLFSTIGITFAQEQCYFAANKPTSSDYVPCGDGKGHFTCCHLGDLCFNDGACWSPSTGMTYIAGCTDASYKDATCGAQHCNKTTQIQGIARPCTSSPQTWLCCPGPSHRTSNPGPTDPNGCPCDGSDAGVAIGSVSNLIETASLPAYGNGQIALISYGPSSQQVTFSMEQVQTAPSPAPAAQSSATRGHAGVGASPAAGSGSGGGGSGGGAVSATAPISASTPSPTAGNVDNNSASAGNNGGGGGVTGMSATMKLGLGIGLPLGVTALCAVAVIIFRALRVRWRWRRAYRSHSKGHIKYYGDGSETEDLSTAVWQGDVSSYRASVHGALLEKEKESRGVSPESSARSSACVEQESSLVSELSSREVNELSAARDVNEMSAEKEASEMSVVREISELSAAKEHRDSWKRSRTELEGS